MDNGVGNGNHVVSMCGNGNITDDAEKKKILKQAYSLSVPFVENKGQIKSKDVRFYANTFGGTVFVEKNGVITALKKGEK